MGMGRHTLGGGVVDVLPDGQPPIASGASQLTAYRNRVPASKPPSVIGRGATTCCRIAAC